MTGTKVEAIHHAGVALGRGLRRRPRARRAEQHPDADRLRVCTVDLGEAEPATIVCGAPNVAAGQTVAVARPGAVMPDGTKLGKAKLRGIVSRRDDPRRDELELGPGDARRDHGARRADARRRVRRRARRSRTCCRSSREVLELEITPNRPDCLGIYGVARELHAATGAPLAPAPWARTRARRATLDGAARRASQCPDLCPRFTARVFEDVTIGPSPLWLKARLTAAGQRPINNVVDITNYVMLADRPAAARVRPRSRRGRAPDRAPGARGREGRDPRRPDAHARRRDGRDRRRRGPDLDRRDHGRRALGGASRRRRACCSRSRPGTARTSTAPRGRSACAARPRGASRRASQPEQTLARAGASRAR